MANPGNAVYPSGSAHSDSFRQRKMREYVNALRRIGTVAGAAREVWVSAVWVRKWMARDADFKAKTEKAMEEHVDLLLAEAQRRAVEGIDKPVFYKGSVCGKIREYSDNLLMFLVKGKRPEYASANLFQLPGDGVQITIVKSGSGAAQQAIESGQKQIEGTTESSADDDVIDIE